MHITATMAKKGIIKRKETKTNYTVHQNSTVPNNLELTTNKMWTKCTKKKKKKKIILTRDPSLIFYFNSYLRFRKGCYSALDQVNYLIS